MDNSSDCISFPGYSSSQPPQDNAPSSSPSIRYLLTRAVDIPYPLRGSSENRSFTAVGHDYQRDRPIPAEDRGSTIQGLAGGSVEALSSNPRHSYYTDGPRGQFIPPDAVFSLSGGGSSWDSTETSGESLIYGGDPNQHLGVKNGKCYICRVGNCGAVVQFTEEDMHLLWHDYLLEEKRKADLRRKSKKEKKGAKSDKRGQREQRRRREPDDEALCAESTDIQAGPSKHSH